MKLFLCLLIANLVAIGPGVIEFANFNAGFGIIGWFPYLLLYALADFSVVTFYITTQDPSGLAKVISYIALTVICLVAVFSGIGLLQTLF